MTLQTIKVDISPRRIATVTLNRPERGNAINQTMLDELADAFNLLSEDDNARVVVIRGAGKHFCTGADLSSRGPSGPPRPAARHSVRDVLAILDGLPKPTVAVVEGGAIGGGAGVVTCCDVAIATRGAFFSVPELRIGMAPFGIMAFMVRAIGHRAFRRYGLTGERIQAGDALRLGLVHEVCEPMMLEATLAQITDALLLSAPHATSALKSAAARYASPTLAEIMASVPPAHDPKSPETQEGIAAFREKRKPSWYPE